MLCCAMLYYTMIAAVMCMSIWLPWASEKGIVIVLVLVLELV